MNKGEVKRGMLHMDEWGGGQWVSEERIYKQIKHEIELF